MDNNNCMDDSLDNIDAYVSIQVLVSSILQACGMFMVFIHAALGQRHGSSPLIRGPNPYLEQIDHINRLVRDSDRECINQLRMDRRTFLQLCLRLQSIGVSHSKFVSLEEKVAMFLYVISHHLKNRKVKFDFRRSGQTVSKYFNEVLTGVLRLQAVLLKSPEPINANTTDDRWRWFQNCLGALDGTYIKVRVGAADQPRYRTRKGDIATNVLGVCSPDMQFIYVLPGWEGSAADCRVLRDAVTRANGLRVPTGYYYLVDAGYTNGQGFLAPYRGQRYHLSLWREGGAPTSPEEFFNMKHSAARNVIERCFGLLKMRWAILRSPSFFPIRTQSRIIIACCLLHNLIRQSMAVDPIESEFDATQAQTDLGDEFINTVEASDQWTDWRATLAAQMYHEWLANSGHS